MVSLLGLLLLAALTGAEPRTIGLYVQSNVLIPDFEARFEASISSLVEQTQLFYNTTDVVLQVHSVASSESIIAAVQQPTLSLYYTDSIIAAAVQFSLNAVALTSLTTAGSFTV